MKVFTTFLYNVDFTLYEGDTKIDTRNANFKLTKSSQILEDSYCPILFESSSLSINILLYLKYSRAILNSTA